MADEITQSQYESLIKRIDTIQDTMDRRFQEWSDDRKDLSELKIEVKTIKTILNATREDVDIGNKKMMDKVDEHLQPIPDLVSDSVKSSIDNIKSKKWYNILRRR